MVASVGLAEAFERFLTSLKAAKKSPNTVDAYRRGLDAVAELLVDPLDKPVEKMRLRDVTVPALREAFAVRAEFTAPATMARTLTPSIVQRTRGGKQGGSLELMVA